jgi:hypothetical protein
LDYLNAQIENYIAVMNGISDKVDQLYGNLTQKADEAAAA